MSSKRLQRTNSAPSVLQTTAPATQAPMSNAEMEERVRAQRQQERANEARGVGQLSPSILDTMNDKLSNPTSTESRPRMGIAERQERVMDVAGKADPFMRTLQGGGTLDETHVKARAVKTRRGGRLNTGAGYSDTDGVVTQGDKPVFGYGANEFGNHPTHQPRRHEDADASRPDYAERLLPSLTNQPSQADSNGGQSRTGRWSEADVDPLTVSEEAGQKIVDKRNSDRLLHTAADSQVAGPDGPTNVDHRFFVTADHYESAVPVSPVETDYAANHPYTKKYDKDGKKL